MGKYSTINLSRKIIAVVVMVMMFFGCIALFETKTFAATEETTQTTEITVKAPKKLTATPEYENVALKWSKVKGATGYQVRWRISGSKYKKKYINKVTLDAKTRKYDVPFDPYPGNKKGRGTSGKAHKVNCEVRAFVEKDGKKYYSDWVKQNKIEVVHPMYVVVKARYNANIYAGPSSYKSVGKTVRGKEYIVIGGSRVRGENKRVIIKVKGKLRYIKSGDVSRVKMVYNFGSKKTNRYTTKQVENFVNTANNGKPYSSIARTRSYGRALVWVNTYHQRVYLFKWNSKTKKWYIHPDYKKGIPCNTGLELTPYGIFKFSSKWYRKESTGTMWWSIFNYVGIHEKLGDALGKPASGGCVRIPDHIAHRFYNGQVRVGQKVLVY